MILPNNEVNPENPNQNDDTIVTRDITFSIDSDEGAVQGASVSIGDISGTTGSAGGCTLHGVSDGEHEVIIYKDGYGEFSRTITVSESNTSFNFSLTP